MKKRFQKWDLWFDFSIAVYRRENKWFDDMANVVREENRAKTVEKIQEIYTKEQIEAEMEFMVKEGYAYLDAGANSLSSLHLTPMIKRALMAGLKRALMQKSKRYEKLYASEGLTKI